MERIVIFNDEDPGIGIELKQKLGGALGWSGACTQCGRPMHRWSRENAIDSAQRHVDSHESGL